MKVDHHDALIEKKIREIGWRGWVKVLRNWNVNDLWLSLHPSMQQLFIETSIFANVLLTGQGCPHLPSRHLISHISPLCKVDRHDRPPLSPDPSSLLISVTAMLYPSQSTVHYSIETTGPLSTLVAWSVHNISPYWKLWLITILDFSRPSIYICSYIYNIYFSAWVPLSLRTKSLRRANIYIW